MPRETRTITPADIVPVADYERIRKAKRDENIVRKRLRRLSVGPHATVLFESWDSMWLQIQEMLRIEKGGDAQLPDELAAYNPMIPNGGELTATMMFEIDDPVIRTRVLGQLGGVEDRIFISIGDERVPAVPEGDVERSRPDGKASSVHFFHFPFTAAQVAAWRAGGAPAMFHVEHPNYGHIALIGDDMRQELARDFA
ncbi:DUF3501 family protein [Sphingomonas colocasiae]|uniref:DUF3501 family protein n=1 Tax=Sphingomonas colocasiae TaxID=1848973 RepID=A0ABS7PU39_9SPHN|nr:DUF3501 family protein [Sphingomonas colocasiae]MBY8824859.1 DUF3501 family protein [Sphingomonas colocasiae]